MTFLNRKELDGLWTVTKQQGGKEFEEAADEEKVLAYLDKLSSRKLQKAYTYKRGIPVITKVIEAELKIIANSEIKREVKNWATNRARESSKESLQFPKVKKQPKKLKSTKIKLKQAGLIEDEDFEAIWLKLLETGKPKPKEAARALAICYVTGARMKEALDLKFEDCSFKKDSGSQFFIAPVRCSKTNPFAARRETLTIPLSVPHAVPIADEIKKLCHNKKKGFMFPELHGNTRAASDYIARYAIKAGINKKVSAHSGRVSYYVRGRRAGMTQAELIHTLRWSPTSTMPDYYERAHMETAPCGVPTKIAKARQQKRQEDKKAKAEKPGSSEQPAEKAAKISPEPNQRGLRKTKARAVKTIRRWARSSTDSDA